MTCQERDIIREARRRGATDKDIQRLLQPPEEDEALPEEPVEVQEEY